MGNKSPDREQIFHACIYIVLHAVVEVIFGNPEDQNVRASEMVSHEYHLVHDTVSWLERCVRPATCHKFNL